MVKPAQKRERVERTHEADGEADRRSLVESAEREAEAQLAIIRAVKDLPQDGVTRVLEASVFLVNAELRVPGVLSAFLQGVAQKRARAD